MVRTLICLLLAASTACAANSPREDGAGPPRPAEMSYNARQFDVASTEAGQTYRIYVGLPPKYDESGQRRYPVLYVLDANGMFATALETVHLALLAGQLPDMIVVGIGYPVADFRDTFQLRMRDYMPEGTPAESDHGGAHKFLRFVRQELKPLINTRYRTVAQDSALFGDSAGGGFGLYTLFTAPDTFNRYALGSPAVVWKQTDLHKHEQRFAQITRKLPVRVYMSAGDAEDGKYVAEMLRLAATLQERDYADLRLKVDLFPGEDHHSVVPMNVTRGLREVFCDPPRASGCGPVDGPLFPWD